MKIIFGTRGSMLALAQTGSVMKRFQACNPALETDMIVIKTTGDRLVDAPLSEIGGFGAFTREIETALEAREIDIAVHSLKDLPVQQPDGLYIPVIVERQTPADVLISNGGYTLESLPKNARVGTSSLRRKMQLLLARPDLEIVEIRGNVPTRLSRVREGICDAVVMALAGLTRLGLQEEAGIQEMTFNEMLPAPGQGALALEIRQSDVELASHLQPLHDSRADVETRCERMILRAFGGGCRSPLGTYARCEGDILSVDAIAADSTLRRFVRARRTGPVTQAEAIGRDIGCELRDGLEL